jgi:CelD/BcsL family acetyltransferase involved in cellulose biosynthesis
VKALSAVQDRSSLRVAAAVPTAASLSVITSMSGLRDLQQKWQALEEHTQNACTVFQSFDWVMAWAETYVDQKGAPSLHILAGYENDELVFLWPLMRTRHMGFATLTWLTDPFGQYGDILCRKGHNSLNWITGAVAFLRRLKDVDILRLRHVRADSHLANHAVNLFMDAKLPEKAPFLDLTQYSNEEAYDARYTSTQRKRRKKIRKSIEDLGPVNFTRLQTGSLADVAVQKAIDEKTLWLSQRGRINRVIACPNHAKFIKNLSRRMNGSVEVVVTELTAGDRPISWEIGFRHRGTHFGYITSHVTTLTDLSPGRLHMDLSQRACLNDGMHRFDLMVPNDVHKESWSSDAVPTNDYYLPISVAGTVMGHVYVRTLRPLLRSIYYGLDASTLRKLNIKSALRSYFSGPTKP